MYQRAHYQILRKRLEEPRFFIQVLTGPRQVGKTTLGEQLLTQLKIPSHSISADTPGVNGAVWLDQQWDVARLKWRQSGAESFILLIDEVQKITGWSDVVKANWDLDTRLKNPIKVILLGSSRLLLQQGLSESLMGRFELIYLPHWTQVVMEEAFGFTPAQYVWFGGYPGAVKLIEDEDRWKKYIKDALVVPSISRDILSLTRIDKPALLHRLFELGSLYSGQVLSFNKILGQLHDAGNTTTLAHYLTLLDTAGLLAGLEKFSMGQVRQRQSSPKFQVHNTALFSALKNETFDQIRLDPEKWGRHVESAVGMHLINYCRAEGHTLNYWTDGNYEIDFVIRSKDKTLGIEVKSGVVRSLQSLNHFRKKYPEIGTLVVGGDGLAWTDFLKINPTDLFR